MYEKIIIAGFGGQGVLFAGTLLARSVMEEGKFVTFFPSYGAEIRGGTANCSVVISTEEIGSPVVADPDTLIVMNQQSLDKFLPRLKKGLLIVNSSLANVEEKENPNIEILEIPASEIADKLGSVKVANVVCIGVYINKKRIVSLQSVEKSLACLLKGKEKTLEYNIPALKKGYEYVK